MSDENNITAGTSPRSTFIKLKIKSQTRRAVTKIVPISAKKAAPLSVMLEVCTFCPLRRKDSMPIA